MSEQAQICPDQKAALLLSTAVRKSIKNATAERADQEPQRQQSRQEIAQNSYVQSGSHTDNDQNALLNPTCKESQQECQVSCPQDDECPSDAGSMTQILQASRRNANEVFRLRSDLAASEACVAELRAQLKEMQVRAVKAELEFKKKSARCRELEERVKSQPYPTVNEKVAGLEGKIRSDMRQARQAQLRYEHSSRISELQDRISALEAQLQQRDGKIQELARELSKERHINKYMIEQAQRSEIVQTQKRQIMDLQETNALLMNQIESLAARQRLSAPVRAEDALKTRTDRNASGLSQERADLELSLREQNKLTDQKYAAVRSRIGAAQSRGSDLDYANYVYKMGGISQKVLLQ